MCGLWVGFKADLSGGFHHLAAGGQTGSRVGTGLDSDVNAFGVEIDHLQEDLAVRCHVLRNVHLSGAVLCLELADLRLDRHAPGDVLVDLAVGVSFEGQDVAEVVLTNVPELGVVGGGEGADNAAHLQGGKGDGGGGGREGRGWCGRGAGCGGGGRCAGGCWCGVDGGRTGIKKQAYAEEEKNFLVHKLNFAGNMPSREKN